MRQVLEVPHQDLISGVNLKDDTAPYLSPFLDLSHYRQFMLSFVATIVGADNVGDVSIQLVIYAEDKVTVLGTVDILTAVDVTDGAAVLVTFGRGLTPAVSGGGTLGAAIGILKVLKWAKFQVTVTTESDAATSALGYLRLFEGN